MIARHTLRLMLPAIAILVALQSSTDAQSPDNNLQWKFAADDVLRYRWTQVTEMRADPPSGELVQVTATQTLDIAWHVQSVAEDGTAQIKQRLERVQLKIDGPGELDVELDTAGEDPPRGYAAMLTVLMEVLANSPIELTVTPLGEIRNVQTFDGLDEALANAPGAEMLGDLASAEGLANLARTVFLPLPANSEASWQSEHEFASRAIGKVQWKRTFRREAAEDTTDPPLAVFAATTKVDRGAAVGAATNITLEDHHGSGRYQFDPERGHVVAAELSEDFSLVDTSGDENVQLDLSVAVKIEMLDESE